MMMRARLLGVLAGILALTQLGACANAKGSMTPSQLETYELRRYCEMRPDDTVKCYGFTGFF